MLLELGQLVGLAGAAGVVGVVGTTGAVLGDSVSFAVAAVLLWLGLAGTRAARPVVAAMVAAEQPRPAGDHFGRGASGGWRVLVGDPVLRIISVTVMLVAWVAVPSAIMAPLVMQLHEPSWWVGILLAADCAGIVLGSAVIRWVSAARQPGLIGPLLLGTYLPLAAFLTVPNVWVAGLLLVGSGAAQAYLPITRAVFAMQVNAIAPHTAVAAFSVVSLRSQAAHSQPFWAHRLSPSESSALSALFKLLWRRRGGARSGHVSRRALRQRRPTRDGTAE
jgi:hypothetical protein